jgi:hypothetical protein
LKDFGEKVFENVPIKIVLKFGESERWYGRVGEMVVALRQSPMIT